MKRVPIWLADDPNSGVFVYWMLILFDLPLDEIVFVSDSRDINPSLSKHFITSDELIANRHDYYLPIMNLGVSSYYTKQIQFLQNRGGFIFFHQLFLHKLIETYYARSEFRSVNELVAYARCEGDRATELLADLGVRRGLDVSEYYLRTFAVQLAEKAIGFCSSWKGAAEQLKKEGLSDNAASRFFCLPPVFSTPEVIPKEAETRKPYDRRPLRLAILGHKTPMKNAGYCLEVVKALNAQGVPSKLVAIGSIGEFVEEAASLQDRRYYERHTASQHSRFLELIDGIDLNMHFRHPFGGEMSLTICETMARGVPSAGYRKDWLLDLPENLWIGAEFSRPPEEAAARIAAAAGKPEQMQALKERVINYARARSGARDTLETIGRMLEFVRSNSPGGRTASKPRLVG